MFMEITLDQLLASRDERHSRQMQLLREYPEKTLVCLTVIMPGKVKRNSLSLTVGEAAASALNDVFADSGICHTEVHDLPTGYEAMFVVGTDAATSKMMTCRLEEEHTLGRLFDVDVINADGTPMSRTDVGMPPRRCLLCEHEARYCMRNKTHTQEELMAEIERLVIFYTSIKK